VAGMTWLRVEPFTAELLVWVLERHLDDSRLVRRRISVADVMPLAKGDDVLEPISPAEQAALMAAVEREGHGDKQGRCDCPRCEERRSRRTEKVLGGDRIWDAGTGNRVIGQGPVVHYGPQPLMAEVERPIAELASLEADRMARAIDREIVGELTVKELRVPALLVDGEGLMSRAVSVHGWERLTCAMPLTSMHRCTPDCEQAAVREDLDGRRLLFCKVLGDLPLGRILYDNCQGWQDSRDDYPDDAGMVVIRGAAPILKSATKGGEDGE
jgi:hypothetical protein